MNPEIFADKLDEFSDKQINKFLSGISSSQTGAYNKVLALTKNLELTSEGQIKNNTVNLRILNYVKQELEKVILTDSYKAKVGTYINSFPEVKGLNDGYFVGLAKEFNSNKHVYKNLLNTSVQLTTNSLLEQGINTNVIDPVKKIITDSITANWSFTDLVDNLRVNLKGTDERLGSMERYASQIATDALNQFSANYNKSVSEDLGFEWYYYSGAKRKTSRPFCKKYAGKYFHKKEIEDFGNKKDINGNSLSSEMQKGWIRGTNSSNIFTYRGGWNCKHNFLVTTISFVPKGTIKRNVEKGYFNA